jgi:hypothetical protein
MNKVVNVSKPRNGLKSKTKICDSCKLERPVWKVQENGQPLCSECSKRISAKKEKKPKTTAPKPKKDKKTLKPIAKLKQELDMVFSWFIRLRDSDENGYCACATCGERIFWSAKGSQNGHFMSRIHQNTRFHEQNCSMQCIGCNVYKAGLAYQHGKHLDQKWGEGTADRMVELSKLSSKLTREWYEEKILYYRERVKELKQEKGLN